MKSTEDQNITDLLVSWRGGDEEALVQLMPLVYRRLRDIAGHLLRRERSNHTLETTALVHEAYLRINGLDRIDWKSRAHFFAMSARLMRRILVDHAKYHGREKRRGSVRLETTELRTVPDGRAPDVVTVDEALCELEKHDTELAQLIELRFFGGLGREELASVMGISDSTITRRWAAARAWLVCYFSQETA